VDPLGEQVELLDAVDDDDHLAVEHEPVVRQLQHLLRDLGEVAVHRLAVPALELHLVSVLEDDRAEAVELRLVAPAVALRQVSRGLRELRLHRRLQRKRHRGATLRPRIRRSMRSPSRGDTPLTTRSSLTTGG
jgi:hypothetical protein